MTTPSARAIDVASILRSMTFQELCDTAAGLIEATGGGIYGPAGDSINRAELAAYLNTWAASQLEAAQKEADE